jgi:lysophospholipase L1-like esterase
MGMPVKLDMGAADTIDGIHLDGAGYEVWDPAVLKEVSRACGAH